LTIHLLAANKEYLAQRAFAIHRSGYCDGCGLPRKVVRRWTSWSLMSTVQRQC